MNDLAFGRRRSVDVGGLALALSEQGSGHGWGGWEETETGETRYAEVLIDVRAHTETAINSEPVHSPPVMVLKEDTRHRLVESLCTWNFEPHKLPEEEVLACSYVLFEALYRMEGIQDAVGVPLSHISSFLRHLRQLYRQGNKYHNFQHALDVLQATYHFLYRAGMVPPVSILLHSDARSWKRHKEQQSDQLICCLSEEDIFVLLIAAIGHDVGHPGLSNAFMKNARTPLAVVYDDKSVLEQMHYSLILQIMRHNGLGFLLDRPHSGPLFRKLLLGTVLATDLSLHAEFMSNFRDLVAGQDVGEHKRKVLVCQALIKCADISNPSRPYNVSKHWAAALESEWISQLMLEQHLHLPATVKPSANSLGEAKGQVWFISTFSRPLFELVTKGIPELGEFAQQCRENLAIWEERSAELSATVGPATAVPNPPLVCQFHHVEAFLSAFPPTLPDSLRSQEEQTHSRASSESSASSGFSHYESCESGPPSPFASPTTSPFSPTFGQARLELASSPSSLSSPQRPPSIMSISSHSTQAQGATAAIREAYKMSVRKKKSFHRSSWNPIPNIHSVTVTPSIPSDGSSSACPSPSSTVGASPLTAGSSPLTTYSFSPLTPQSASSASRPDLASMSCNPD
ncbi:HD-domain/PDEase-like protein [Laetiporus sulphureus 93-53]|uniref:Phosphodiesterase n=1 Tax=Laetiporus sulphureus 93-53 TaxID=1314785 RepID=A0A165CKI8_9APHY|nr:HD-domain/PDEase-like protein [Laetiporus sulphureus 93-53]KZT02979.1 HD-domain/PDEase-like protein [Laetiporus sulphureus 93-53]